MDGSLEVAPIWNRGGVFVAVIGSIFFPDARVLWVPSREVMNRMLCFLVWL